MGLISLRDARPGMVLDADVTAAGDRLLLRAGTPLTEHHLRVFSMWGIVDVDVEGLSKADIAAQVAAQLDPAVLEELATKVDTLFRHTDGSHPMIDELVRLTTLRLIRLASGTGDGG